MVNQCLNGLRPPLDGEGLREYMRRRVDLNKDEADRLSSRLADWYARPGAPSTKGMNAAFNRNVAELEILLATENFHQSVFFNFILAQFLRNYSSGLTRLDGSRDGPVSLLENAFATVDCLAAGRFRNAEALHDQAMRLLDQRAFSEQDRYAADLERRKDPGNFVEIIPQRLFVFAHELMAQRRRQGKQPWSAWDIVSEKDYIDAARNVYTADPELAEATLCKLCNLHVTYSNPFPEGDNDDSLTGIEFDTPLRSLWPTEIFAWLRLRQERGLPLPEVSHPLLEQPFGRFGPEIIIGWRPEVWFVEFVNKLVQFNPRYNDLPDMIMGPA